MKKNKFLSGLSAKLALAIVALTTTMFTSCEKENIGIEVTPVNAKFIITPVVIDATTGTDVTQSAEISFSKGNGTYEGTPELASESININAKYKGMTGSASVTIPALKAGQFGAKEVTIILSENFFAQEESSNSQIETTKHSGFKNNTSDYWYYITVTYTKKEGSEVIKNDYEGDDSEIKNIIDAYNKGVREDKVTLNDVQVLAHSRFSVFVDYMKTTSVYQIIEKSPKRDGNPVASFTVDSYNSHLDWAREDYPWGRTGQGTGRSNSKGDWKSYYQFMNNQLTELLTNYGPIGAIWFDGWWDQPKSFNWELPEQYALIHKLQPGCLVGNNHHQTPFDGEDIQIFERDLPGENASGLSGQEVSRLPLETCETMNGMWGYKITDQNYKSTKTLIHYLVKAAGKNANLLMNIGPQPDGELPAVAVQRLAEMGEWMKQYGETIYGTRSGIVAPHDWGVTTQKGNKLYVHILDLKDAALFLPLTGKKVKKAVLFKDQSPVRFTKTKAGVLLEFAEVPKDIDYVVELTID